MKGTAYLLQATLVSLWWIGLFFSQEFFDAFQFPGIGKLAFNSLMIPDLLIITSLSLLRSYYDRKEIEYLILGGFSYATLYCLNAMILTGGGLLSTTLMSLGLGYNIFLVNENRIFRESSTNSCAVNALKTSLQIICVWTISLVIFPVLILWSFGETMSSLGDLYWLGILLFGLFSTLGIWSAYHMVVHGEGTPLPLDQAKTLVVSGPYDVIRNPMAVAGVGQVIGIGLVFGSIHIFVYALIGALVWQFSIRPLEENNLAERFGDDYMDYRERVQCWIPR